MPSLPAIFESSLAQSLLTFLVALTLLLLLRTALLRWLSHLSRRTTSALDDLLVEAVRFPTLLWAGALATDLALRHAELGESIGGPLAMAVRLLVILASTLVVANATAAFLQTRLRKTTDSGAASGITRVLVKGLVFTLGLSLVLHELGVAVGPLLTALGVGGLAVALALQDTLGNLFAGVHILLERPFAIGHFIRVEGGDQGWVQDIGWRTTRILTLDDHTVVLPNSMIAGSMIINMTLPDPVVRVEVKVALSYDVDVARALRALQGEIELAAQDLSALVEEPKPDVLLEKLSDWSLEFTVRFYIRQVSLERAARHEVHVRLLSRLAAEQMRIPYPHYVVERR